MGIDINDWKLGEDEFGGGSSTQTPALIYLLDIILACVRGYVAYAQSPGPPEEMMVERGVSVDHFDDPPLGHQAVADIGECVSPPQAAG